MNQKRRPVGRLSVVVISLRGQQFIHSANDNDYFAFDFQWFALLNEDWLHRRVGRLQAIAIPFLEEILQCSFIIAWQPDRYHFTIACICGWLENNDISIVDHRIDHGVSLDFEAYKPSPFSLE